MWLCHTRFCGKTPFSIAALVALGVVLVPGWATPAQAQVQVSDQDSVWLSSGTVYAENEQFEMPVHFRYVDTLGAAEVRFTYDTALFEPVLAGNPPMIPIRSAFGGIVQTAYSGADPPNQVWASVWFAPGGHPAPDKGPFLYVPFRIRPGTPHGAIGRFEFFNDADLAHNILIQPTGIDTVRPTLIDAEVTVCSDPSCVWTINEADTFSVVQGAEPLAAAANEVIVDIALRNTSPVQGVSFRMRYDPNVLEPIADVVLNNPYPPRLEPLIEQLRGAPLNAMSSAVTSPGVIAGAGVYFVNDALAPGSGPLLRFRFNVLPNATPGTMSPIVFEQDPWFAYTHNTYAYDDGLSTSYPVQVGGGVMIPAVCGPCDQGDVNNNGIAGEIGDVVFLINYLFRASGIPPASYANCPAVNSADVNCNGRVNIVDVVLMIQYVVGTVAELCDPCQGYPLPPVVFTDADPSYLLGDPYAPEGAVVTGDMLKLSVAYSGGCVDHGFDVFMSPIAFMESDPVQANLYPRHDDPGDDCDAWVMEDRWFRLTPIADLYRATYGGPGMVLLNIYNADHSAFRQVVYEVGPSR